MTVPAALLLGSLLWTVSNAQASAPEPTVHAPEETAPTPGELKRARQRRSTTNAIMGTLLEFGSGSFHALNGGTLIGRDVRLSSEGCNASNKPCAGPPFLVLVPAGATIMGWFGAARIAEAREANVRDSWLYWVGSGVEIAAYIAWAAGSKANSGDAMLARDTTFVSLAVLGTTLQVVGALTGPTRAEVEILASHSPHVIPGCAPVAGGMTCGIVLAGF